VYFTGKNTSWHSTSVKVMKLQISSIVNAPGKKIFPLTIAGQSKIDFLLFSPATFSPRPPLLTPPPGISGLFVNLGDFLACVSLYTVKRRLSYFLPKFVGDDSIAFFLLLEGDQTDKCCPWLERAPWLMV
jgi:hypothetical protein